MHLRQWMLEPGKGAGGQTTQHDFYIVAAAVSGVPRGRVARSMAAVRVCGTAAAAAAANGVTMDWGAYN